jgi:hypothetical protein
LWLGAATVGVAPSVRADHKAPGPAAHAQAPASYDEGALIAPAFDKGDKPDKATTKAKTQAVVPPAPAAPPEPPPSPAAPPADPAATNALPGVTAPSTQTPGPTATEQAAPLLERVDELATLEAAAALAEAARPRFSMSIAMGISVDTAGVADHRNVMIPSFAVMGGVGQKLLGFEARLFASEAAGRYSTPNPAMGNRLVADVGADRQAVDLLLAVRPLAAFKPEDDRWGARFARGLTANVGLGGERVSVAAATLFRLGAVVGAHADFPLTPAHDRSELDVRLSVRRMFGSSGTVGTGAQAESIGDTKVEALAGLAFVF